MDGNILANGTGPGGADTRTPGGGSGGSIWIIAGTWAGSTSGVIAADGAAGWGGDTYNGGGGGGGRVAVEYTNKTFTGTVRAKGGNNGAGGGPTAETGGAGTIWLKEGTNNPDLVIDNGRSSMSRWRGAWYESSWSNTLRTITIRQCGILTHPVNGTSDQGYRVDLTLQTLTIESKGYIYVSGKGYAGGTGSGYGTNGVGTPGGGQCASGYAGGGGGYGGEGGNGGYVSYPEIGGLPYGTVSQPIYLGSGGGGYGTGEGGYGGGLIKLTVDYLLVDGSILASGLNPVNGAGTRAGGGGSGGSIWIIAGLWAGSTSGVIAADGGAGWSGSSYNGGGGGGGRVAIQSTNKTFAGTVRAQGGNNGAGGGATAEAGGAGTVWLKDGTNSPDLIIANGRSSMSGWKGVWSEAAWSNALRTITLRQCGGITHPANGTNDQGYRVDITVPTLTIESNGFIYASGMGYSGGTSAGYGTNGVGTPGGGGFVANAGGGGGYGGAGGISSLGASGGLVYGSVTNPAHLGSGGAGGGTFAGGAGGGAVKLNVNTLQLDGSIDVSGVGGSSALARSSGGGSGGSIWIIANRFSGAGSLDASGGYGNYGTTGSGGGGGGRIAIYAISAPFYTQGGFAGTYHADGGAAYLGATAGTNGTLYLNFKPRGTVLATW